jgi:hypothetical protein
MRTFTLYLWLVLTYPMAWIMAYGCVTFSEKLEAAQARKDRESIRRFVLLCAICGDSPSVRLHLAIRMKLARRKGYKQHAMIRCRVHNEFIAELGRIAATVQ